MVMEEFYKGDRDTAVKDVVLLLLSVRDGNTIMRIEYMLLLIE